MADETDLGYEHEIVQPVQSISGVTLYNKISRKPCGPAVDSKGRSLDYGSKPLLVEVDARNNQVRTSERSDGANCHLIRQTLAPIVEAPAGYYLLEPAAVGTRARVVRDSDGKLLALETEPVPSDSPNRWRAEQQPGFAVADEAS